MVITPCIPIMGAHLVPFALQVISFFPSKSRWKSQVLNLKEGDLHGDKVCWFGGIIRFLVAYLEEITIKPICFYFFQAS